MNNNTKCGTAKSFLHNIALKCFCTDGVTFHQKNCEFELPKSTNWESPRSVVHLFFNSLFRK